MSSPVTDAAAVIMGRLERNPSPDEFFGTSATRVHISNEYRLAAKHVHPDLFIGHPLHEHVSAMFIRLTTIRDAAFAKMDGPTPEPKRDPLTVKTGRRTYTVGDLVTSGDYADQYDCTWQDGDTEARGIFKIVRSAADNDLAKNEATVLAKLYPAKQAEEKFYRLLPRLYDSFELKEKVGKRRVVVLGTYPEHISIENIMRAYPDGVDFRDAVWMFKRTLMALGFVHREGYVHGAVLPPRVLVHPVEHGAKIVDWSAAVPMGQKVRSLSPRFKDLYAPEILGKLPVSAATDIYMAAQTFKSLSDANTPKQIGAFLDSCLLKNPARRPDDAWALHEDFDELLLRVVGKRKYRPFPMPEDKKDR